MYEMQCSKTEEVWLFFFLDPFHNRGIKFAQCMLLHWLSLCKSNTFPMSLFV